MITRPPCFRAATAAAMSAAFSTAARYTARTPAVLLLGLAELVDELVGVAPDGLVEAQLLVVVGWVTQHVALALVDEAGVCHLLLHGGWIDAVQGVGVAQPRARLGDVIDNQERPAGFQRPEYRPVQDHGIDLAHEFVRIVMVVLDGEDEVH